MNAHSTPAAAEAQSAPVPPRRRRRLGLMIAVPLVLAAGGTWYWMSGGRYVETDNAQVEQAKVALSADVAGRIIEVHVGENQPVKAGDLLFALDPAPYEIAVRQAEAALASARVNVSQLKVAYKVASAKLAAAQSTAEIRQKQWDRKSDLSTQGIAAQASLDDIRLALDQAQSAVRLEEQDVAAATAALSGNPDLAVDDYPAVKAALAALDTAKRNLDKTRVIAPADGLVAQVGNLNVGQFIGTGTTIATLVETGSAWIEANFKETQLADLKAGLPADLSIDAYPGQKFKGHVDSIGAGTGAEFALIPAQNASGNWVKVVQRVPVKLVFDTAPTAPLRTGMSATVSVDLKPQS